MGLAEGSIVGSMLGPNVGWDEGAVLVRNVGCDEGASVGETDGTSEGVAEGAFVGSNVGSDDVVGLNDGDNVGLQVTPC